MDTNVFSLSEGQRAGQVLSRFQEKMSLALHFPLVEFGEREVKMEVGGLRAGHVHGIVGIAL